MSSAALERSVYWFLHPFRVRYAEADWHGRLFNAHYLTYFGTTMVEYMRALPFDLRGHEKRDNTAIHVVRAVVDVRTPVRFDNAIEVGVRTARLGRTSLTYALAIFPAGSAEVLAMGEMVWVYTSRETHKSTGWPDELRNVIRSREGEPSGGEQL